MRDQLRVIGRGLGWILATVGCVTVFAFAAAIPVAIAGRTLAGYLVALTTLVALAVLMWILLRSRVEVPALVWLVVGVNLILNVAAIGVEELLYSGFGRVSPEAASVVARTFPKIAVLGETVYRVVVVQGALAATAGLAFALRRGPVLGTPRRRMTALLGLAVVALASTYIVWSYTVTFYGFAMDLGHEVTASAGETVSIVDGIASLRVPAGWEARVHRPVAPPPQWLHVPRKYITGEPYPTRVRLQHASQSASESVSTTSSALIFVFADQKTLRDDMRLRSDGESFAPYQWPARSGERRPDAAFMSTKQTDSGWNTFIEAYFNDPQAPFVIRLIVPHSTPATPSPAAFEEQVALLRISR